MPAFVAFSIVPVGGTITIGSYTTRLQLADPPWGILVMLMASSISVYGVMLAGWSSGSKYPLMGSVRASAQMISYEAALGLSVATVVLLSGSLHTSVIVAAQHGGFLYHWNILRAFGAPAAIFFIAITAEMTRPPFDLVEAEEELAGGFNLEYSSIGFALVLPGRVHGPRHQLRHLHHSFPGRPRRSPHRRQLDRPGVVHHKGARPALHLRVDPGHLAPPALRPAHGPRLETAHPRLPRAPAHRGRARVGWRYGLLALSGSLIAFVVLERAIEVGQQQETKRHVRAGGAMSFLDQNRFVSFFKGFLVTGKQPLKPKVTIQYPEHKRPKPERAHGRHVLNRYEDGMEKCIGCELCAGCLPRPVHIRTGGGQPARRAGLARRAVRVRVRDQLPALYPLRPLRRGLPDRGDNRVEAVRVLLHQPGRRHLHQGRAGRRRFGASPRRCPGRTGNRATTVNTSAWMRATSPSGRADLEGVPLWSGELGYGVRPAQAGQSDPEAADVPADFDVSVREVAAAELKGVGVSTVRPVRRPGAAGPAGAR